MENITSKVLCGVGATLLLAGCGGDSKSNIAIGPPASTTQGVSQLLFDAYGGGLKFQVQRY